MELIYTIGHSTRTLDELVQLLRHNGVKRLADIRRYPGSRRYPHFSGDSLRQSLPAAGIEYLHFEDLGGRRKPAGESPNTGLRNEQFRAYADYMATAEFHAAVDRLTQSEARTAYMCAEAVPWRCHRNLLSDELVRRGLRVVHILGAASRQEHGMNELAVIVGDHVEYRPKGSTASLF
ncbi:MAG TPA: DUF488 domain-containing protein [Thermoanaerobaculia bacterium]|nr:DUF488 domain-containing protein [Thermoanaerobaculia bacterium]